jgi:hypothetical protein
MRMAVLTGTVDVDIQHLSDTQAPVALLVHKGDKTNEIRSHDGDLYRPLWRSAADDADAKLETMFANPLGGGHHRYTSMAITHELARKTMKEWPPGIAAAIEKDADPRNPAVVIAGEALDRVDFDMDALATIERWKDRTAALASAFIVVDGKVWEKTVEPMYRVTLGTSYASPVTLSDSDPYSAGSHIDDAHFFSVADRAAMERFYLDNAVEPVASALDGLHVDVLRPELIRPVSAELEFERFARAVAHDVTDFIIYRAKKDPESIQEHDPEFMLAWSRLKAALARTTAYSGDCSAFEDETTGLVEALAIHRTPYGGFPLLRSMTEASIAAGMSRWTARPIGVDYMPSLDR